jgi:hypothetical protein
MLENISTNSVFSTIMSKNATCEEVFHTGKKKTESQIEVTIATFKSQSCYLLFPYLFELQALGEISASPMA